MRRAPKRECPGWRSKASVSGNEVGAIPNLGMESREDTPEAAQWIASTRDVSKGQLVGASTSKNVGSSSKTWKEKSLRVCGAGFTIVDGQNSCIS